MYILKIDDHDVGGIINTESFDDLKDLINEVKEILWSIEEPEDDELYMEQVEHFNVSSIRNALAKFDFCNGFCEMHINFPGEHRALIVSKQIED